jgi:adenosine kinase
MFGGDELKRFIELASWVTVNDYEWELVTNLTGLSKDDVQKQVKALIITRGAEGSDIHAEGETIHIPAAKASSTADPTGCGDAHRAGLLHGLTHQLDWETTGRIASLMGTIKVENYGTQNHRFEMSEVEARFKEEFGRDI